MSKRINKPAYVRIVERILGKSLPKGAVVHHVDGDRFNNTSSNLVVCPSMEYHHLLHHRIRAIEACGDPNYRKCYFCKEWDLLFRLMSTRPQSGFYHKKCGSKYHKAYRTLQAGG